MLFDVQQGKVSIQAAADDYGVVIRDGAIDETATAAPPGAPGGQRQGDKRQGGIFAFNAEREAYEREWTTPTTPP